MVSTVVLVLYVVLFVYHAWRSEQKQWILGASVLALASTWLLSNLLPGLVYQHVSAILYLSPFWLGLSSLFFFVSKWRYHRATQVFYAEPPCTPYLIYLAVSGMMMHLAWLVPVLWSSYQYPDGLSFYTLMGLSQLYLLQPVYWILAQWSLMAMLHVAQRWHRSPITIVSTLQLQFAFLFGLLAISVYVSDDLLQYVK